MKGHDPQYSLEQLLGMSEASTQIALQKKEAILHVPGCRECPESLLSFGQGEVVALLAEVCARGGSVSPSKAAVEGGQ